MLYISVNLKSRFKNNSEAQDAYIEDKVQEVEQRVAGLTRILQENDIKEKKKGQEGTLLNLCWEKSLRVYTNN